MKPIELHPSAQRELVDSIDWYNQKEPGLGYEFYDSVIEDIKRIHIFPEMWPEVYNSIRRFHIHRFPYSILYQELEDKFFVFAIMHDSRSPLYWVDRVSDK